MNERPSRLVGAVILLLALGSSAACGRHPGRAVVLISIDTLRPDHLGIGGYGRDTSPHLDRFAREDAVVFEAAYAQAPYTLPSHMSIFTGLYPETHGVLLPRWNAAEGPRAVRVGRGVPILGELFRAAGYATQAFTDGLLVDGRFGFDRGFDSYRGDYRHDGRTNGFQQWGDDLDAWIGRHADESFLLFVHTYDTHAPYSVPEPWRSRFATAPPGREIPPASLLYCSLLGVHEGWNLTHYASIQEILDAYDGTIAYVDVQLARIFDRLKREGLWDEAVVVVASDHGERFMENGLAIGHGLGLVDEEVRIPLLVKLPGSRHAGRRIARVVESVDILPTVLAAAGIPVPGELDGQNLLAGLDDDTWKKDHAFGVSPHTGFNHYLLRAGEKFIEGPKDSANALLRQHLKPMFLRPMWPPPTDIGGSDTEAKDWESVLYTRPETDPLGVAEAFDRGDRIYELQPGSSEWQTSAIRDDVRLRRAKSAVYALVARARRRAATFGGSADEPAEDLPPETIARLEAMGYVGVGAPAAVAPESDPDSIAAEVHTVPARLDRTLLDRGDAVLWEITRYLGDSGVRPLPARFRPGIERARDAYRAFHREHPEKWIWVYWRLRSLDLASANVSTE